MTFSYEKVQILFSIVFMSCDPVTPNQCGIISLHRSHMTEDNLSDEHAEVTGLNTCLAVS